MCIRVTFVKIQIPISQRHSLNECTKYKHKNQYKTATHMKQKHRTAVNKFNHSSKYSTQIAKNFTKAENNK